MLYEWGLENKMEVRRLQADKCAEEIQCLDAVLLLQEEVVECEE